MDDSGVIAGDELKELKVWVDDGDAKTDELQSLQKHKITEIVIWSSQMTSTTKTQKQKNSMFSLKTAKRSLALSSNQIRDLRTRA